MDEGISSHRRLACRRMPAKRWGTYRPRRLGMISIRPLSTATPTHCTPSGAILGRLGVLIRRGKDPLHTKVVKRFPTTNKSAWESKAAVCAHRGRGGGRRSRGKQKGLTHRLDHELRHSSEQLLQMCPQRPAPMVVKARTQGTTLHVPPGHAHGACPRVSHSGHQSGRRQSSFRPVMLAQTRQDSASELPHFSPFPSLVRPLGHRSACPDSVYIPRVGAPTARSECMPRVRATNMCVCKGRTYECSSLNISANYW